jgi:hypothetical protein
MSSQDLITSHRLLKLVMMKMTCSVKANRPTNHRSQDQILISSMVMTLRIKSLLNRQRLKRLEIQLVFHINVTNVTIQAKTKATTRDTLRISMTQSLQRLKSKKQVSQQDNHLKSKNQE